MINHIVEWHSDASGKLYRRETIEEIKLGKWTIGSSDGHFHRVTEVTRDERKRNEMTRDEMRQEIDDMSAKLDRLADSPNSNDLESIIVVVAMLINLVREMVESTSSTDKK